MLCFDRLVVLLWWSQPTLHLKWDLILMAAIKPAYVALLKGYELY